MEVLKLFGAPLITAVLVAILSAILQNRSWKRQKATEQKISLIREWEAFVGAVEYAYQFGSGDDPPHPESVRLLLTRQKSLLASIRTVFVRPETLDPANNLLKALTDLGQLAWSKNRQPPLTQMREVLLERMNKEAFS